MRREGLRAGSRMWPVSACEDGNSSVARAFSRAVAALALAASACASAASGPAASAGVEHMRMEVDELLRRHESEVRRLDEVGRRIRLAEVTLEAHRSRVALAECTAMRSEIEAGVSAMRADCLVKLAQYNGCVARQSEETLGNELWGGLVGLTAAVLTGGAAAPFVLGGAVAGRLVSNSSEDACGFLPACTSMTDGDRRRTIILARGLDAAPDCEHEQNAGCAAEHFLFLSGQLEVVTDPCLADREGEFAAERYLLDLGLRGATGREGEETDQADDEGLVGR